MQARRPHHNTAGKLWCGRPACTSLWCGRPACTSLWCGRLACTSLWCGRPACTVFASPNPTHYNAYCLGDIRMKDDALREMLEQHEPPLTSGSCILRNPSIGALVQDSLLYFERSRYYLSAWCIMPNHVHAVATPIGGFKLNDVLHSWKSFTAHQINKMIQGTGEVWERESFDHAIRSCENWSNLVEYTYQNPVVAGLCAGADAWPFSSRGTSFQAADEVRFVDPRELTYVRPQYRGELPHLFKDGCTFFVTFRLFDAVILKRSGKKPAAQMCGRDARTTNKPSNEL